MIQIAARASVAALAVLLLAYWGTGAASVPGPQGASQGVSSPVPPPCLTEDGGSEPCAWQCATMGNRTCGPNTPPVIIIHQEG